MPEKVYEPIPPPIVHKVNPRANLTDAQQEMYESVLEHFSKPGYQVPGVEEKNELMEAEKFWLSYECLLRYLRAVKWKSAEAAIGRLEATLKWRREYGIYDILTAELVEPESVTGKQFPLGYDTQGRPTYYMFPSRQNTDVPAGQIQQTVWLLERIVDLMGPGVETLTLMINYGDKSKGPSLSTGRQVLSILQDHYPERLGISIIIQVPFLMKAFFRLITPFIDPVSVEKMKFNADAIGDNLVSADMLMSGTWGGDCDFEYVHEKYWPALVSLCESRRTSWVEKWKTLGGRVGIREWDYKDGETGTTSASDLKAETTDPEKVAENTAEKDAQKDSEKVVEKVEEGETAKEAIPTAPPVSTA